MTDSTTVSSQWLYEQRDRRKLVVVDCRFSLSNPQLGQQQYLTSHIPGAYYLDLNQDLSDPAGLHGGRHPLPNPLGLSKKLSEMGIDSETLVVAYDDSRFAFAARFWWLLRYLGHERGAVLDGGFSAYQAAGYPVTKGCFAKHPYLPAARTGAFVPQLQPDRVVDVEAVRARKDLPDVVLIDSREAERYRGEREPIDPVAGHIPGAVNYPWQAVSDDRGYLQPWQQPLQGGSSKASRWANLAQAKEILVYCGSGVTACVNLLALETLGIQTGKLYAGSWSDWCSYKSLPIAQGE